jgi:hypothetical protein
MTISVGWWWIVWATPIQMFSVVTLWWCFTKFKNFTFVCVIFNHPLSITIVLLYAWWHVMLGIDWSAMYTNLIPLYVVINEGICFLPHHKHKHYFWAKNHDLRHTCDDFLSLRKCLNIHQGIYKPIYLVNGFMIIILMCCTQCTMECGLQEVCKLFLPIPLQIETHHMGTWIRRIL